MIRLGFVSNSSSSSFVIFAKEPTLEEALHENFNEIFKLPKESSPAVSFLISIKERICNELADNDFNHFEFEYTNEAHTWTEEKTDKISDYETFEKFVDPSLRKDEVLDEFKAEKHAFMLDVPDFGEGGTVIQKASRFALQEMKSPKISIYNYETFFS